eukprot:gnl/MRDRNA2_/MRDRNA2_98504_c0_seq1.p1 gnl/MRDRNA2_/MRDRNA2_98504_c0~~gnl/MRDRNA2_/MRDRNA2_98504_c0_seq1.p1  ORF type:complete len:829 (+),score=138.53 gnl/MRDRNA2_/MRDRNA2_98504_c0_seq1:70-2556(+)
MSGVSDMYPLRSGTGECSTPTGGETTVIGAPAIDKSLWKSGIMPSKSRTQTSIVGPLKRLMIGFVLIACGGVLALSFTLFHSDGHDKVRLRGEVERLKARSDILAKHFALAKQEKHDLAKMILDTKSREVLSNLLERSSAFDKFVQQYGFTATPSNTKNVRKCLQNAITKFNITSMLDASCGDGSWQHLIPSIKEKRVTYVGGDINIKALEHAKMNEDNQASGMDYFLFDSVHFPLRRPFDLILFRDVIEHLQIDDALTSLLNFKESQSTYIAVTYWPQTHKDANKAAYLLEKGDVAWYETNLLLPPFNFPKPLISCENDDEGPNTGKSLLGIWRLSDLPITKDSILKAEQEQSEQKEKILAEKKKAEAEKREIDIGPCATARKEMMSMPFEVRHQKYDCGLDPDHGGCSDFCPCYEPGNGDNGPHCFHLSEEHKGLHLASLKQHQNSVPPELAQYENHDDHETEKLYNMALNFTRDFKRGKNKTSLSEEDFADAMAHLFVNQQREQPFDGLLNPYLSTPRGPPGFAQGQNGPWVPNQHHTMAGVGPAAQVLQRGPNGEVRHVGTMHGNKILKQGPDGQVRQVGTVHGNKILAHGPDGQVKHVGNLPIGPQYGGPGRRPVPGATAQVIARGPDGQVKHIGTMHGNKILQQGPNGEVRQVGSVHGNKIFQRGPDGQMRQIGSVDDSPDIQQIEPETSPTGPTAHVMARGPDGQVKHVGTVNGNKIMKQGPDGEMKQVGTVHGDKVLLRGPDGQVMHVGNIDNLPDDDDASNPFQSDGSVFDMPDFARLHGLGNGYNGYGWSPQQMQQMQQMHPMHPMHPMNQMYPPYMR